MAQPRSWPARASIRCPPPGSSLDSVAASNVQLQLKVAELEREVEEVRHLAHHDSLTGLPNRALLLDRLHQAMLQAIRQRKAVGLLLLDLDGFKNVNDGFGHHAGDAILQGVATRLMHCIRGCDTACRYGGDEFVILLPEISGVDVVERVERKIRACLAVPHRLSGRAVTIAASIGSVVFSHGAANCDELIAAADTAMYRAKARRPRRMETMKQGMNT
jgi:diguanylate cyclase (GGDEF)-like protein